MANGWFCPCCNAYHSPECLTCPTPVPVKDTGPAPSYPPPYVYPNGLYNPPVPDFYIYQPPYTMAGVSTSNLTNRGL